MQHSIARRSFNEAWVLPAVAKAMADAKEVQLPHEQKPLEIIRQHLIKFQAIKKL